MNTVADLCAQLERLAPRALAEPWDNTGLLLGDPSAPLDGPVLLTIDLRAPVVEEAVVAGARAIIAYHPPIFAPLRSLTAAGAQGAALLACARRGIAVYSPHTALDAAQDGVTDWLIDTAAGERAGTQGRAALAPAQVAHTSGNTHKVVTFVPVHPSEAIERVRTAMANSGAGVIGAYEQCAFAVRGTGTFHGRDGANPTVGQTGRLESVEELRLEMVARERDLPAIAAAIRAAHPYEEPPIDVLALVAERSAAVGAGRVADLIAPAGAADVALRLRAALPSDAVLIGEAPKLVGAVHRRIAACPGSGGSLLDAAIGAGATLFVTGEMKHHEVLGALDRGVSVVLAGHTQTERGYLRVLASRLGEAAPGARFMVSTADAPPLRAV